MLLSCTFLSVAEADMGIGDAAKILTEHTSILSKLLLAACFVLSGVLIFTGISQYKIHRHNPKLVPLINPCVYFFLGLLLLVVPFTDHLFGADNTGSPYQGSSKSGHCYHDADDAF
jgi:hypothetical protein